MVEKRKNEDKIVEKEGDSYFLPDNIFFVLQKNEWKHKKLKFGVVTFLKGKGYNFKW